MSMDDAKLTLGVREAARDADALAWGSLDVTREDVLSRVRALTPEEGIQLDGVLTGRVEASRVRERRHERTAEVLRCLIERLES